LSDREAQRAAPASARRRTPSRLVYVDHIVGHGAELFDHIQAIGAEGIVPKHLGSRDSGGESRNWRKTKCDATGHFVVTGFQELGPAGLKRCMSPRIGTASSLLPARFGSGLPVRGLWAILDRLRASSPGRYGICRSSLGWRSK